MQELKEPLWFWSRPPEVKGGPAGVFPPPLTLQLLESSLQLVVVEGGLA